MKTITNSEFLANPEMYLGMALEQDVRVQKGEQTIRLILESADYEDDDELTGNELTDDQVWALFAAEYPDGLPPLLSDEEEIANSITFDELMVGVREDLREMFAKGKHNVQ